MSGIPRISAPISSRYRAAITSDTALRLAKYFSNSPEFWLNLQQMHDLSKTRLESGERIEREVRVGQRIA